MQGTTLDLPNNTDSAMYKREIYLGIDLLRFVAAVWVMAYHLGYKAWSLDNYYLHEKLMAPDILWGWSEETWLEVARFV